MCCGHVLKKIKLLSLITVCVACGLWLKTPGHRVCCSFHPKPVRGPLAGRPLARENSYFIFFFYLKIFIVFFGGSHLRRMEIPGLGVQSELQLPAYTTATAMPDPSHICDLHRNLMVPSRIRFCCATTGTPRTVTLLLVYLHSETTPCPPSLGTGALGRGGRIALWWGWGDITGKCPTGEFHHV